ncbi:CRE-NMUR-2 protein, partial [Aphelenchoides avenae]
LSTAREDVLNLQPRRKSHHHRVGDRLRCCAASRLHRSAQPTATSRICAKPGVDVLALLITAVYCHIVAKIKSTDKYLVAENAKRQMRGRKGLLKVLVAVVVMFFLSWLPFHVQRLLTVYLNEHQAQLENLSTVTLIFNSFFYFSGYCYYSNSCCNPILYNILSEKYRRAFSRTILGDKFASRFFNSRDGSLQLHHMPGNVHRKQTIATPCSGASTMPQHLRPKLS